ncbi:MAG: DNA gyrase subunit A [Bacteroidia bacterium]|nr:DNA gyrase subunit A [Bacteroidia bacterium]
MTENDKIITRLIEEEMKTAYIDYSMSVIVSRALPDVRDGLKPVHRRVLYGMSELGLASNRPYKKSARIVGEVLGKFHPHGDSAVYDTMVRMAQDWSLRYPLVDGQGNFGSQDGDNPAAMRYTEARLRRVAEEMLEDLEKDTVDFRNNFDDSLTEPSVLPAKIPNLLVNGASGIAVGMATNMPPHNLGEVVEAIVAYIDDRSIEVDGLMQHIKGPDFPTGGIIQGVEGIQQAFATGRGRVVIRARAEIIGDQHSEQIIIHDVPYQVNKATTIEKIGQLVDEKKLEGIEDVRDESTKDVRIVIDLKRDANAKVVLNKLYQLTPLQTSFSINNVALVNGRPHTLNLKDMIRHYVDHRHEVVVRRTRYELAEARKRAHILEGLLIALDHLDEVINLIRNSRTADEARDGLMTRFGLSEIQAKAILDLRLQRLTGLERENIQNQYREIMARIEYLESILNDEVLRMSIIKQELLEVRDKYGDPRRTEITYAEGEIRMEDIIANEDMVITITNQGYIKRTKASEYQAQGRGGTGARGVGRKDTDFVEHLFTAHAHNVLLFFTEHGRCYWLRVYEVPEGDRTHRGRAIQNLIQIEREDSVKAFVTLEGFDDEDFVSKHSIIMATRRGLVKKTPLEDYSRPRASGIIAININTGDELIEARLTNGDSEIVLAASSGYAVRFHEDKVRDMGRTATGVRGITLQDEQDAVIGMVVVAHENQNLLVVSEKGYGKQSPISEYRLTNRGGKGVKTINISPKTGKLVAIKQFEGKEDEGLMIATRWGMTIRMRAADISLLGRNTQGVRLIKLREGDGIASVAYIMEQEADENTADLTDIVAPNGQAHDPAENADETFM